MTALGLLVMSPHPDAHADGRAPRASLIDRATAAPWIPRLTLGASLARVDWPRHAALETTFYGGLSWPLERPPPGVPALSEHRARERARASHLARLAEAWRRRHAAAVGDDELASRLDADEADAEIDALDDEDAP